jgi:hypothetical protein
MKKLLLTLTGVSTMITALFAQVPDLTVCEGKGYTLNSTAEAPPFGATSYTWYEDGEPLPDSNSASYTIQAGQAAGEYKYVRVASNAECPGGVPSNTFTVTVNPLPDPPVMGGDGNAYCNSGTITATAGSNGNGIRWDDGSTLTLRTVNTTGANTYRAVTTSAAGCTSSTATITVTVSQGAAAGQAPDATCGCAEGLNECNSVCSAASGWAYWPTCSSTGFNYVTDVPADCGETSMRWAAADAYCKEKGGHLPTTDQATCMCDNRDALPGGVSIWYYWTSSPDPPGGSAGRGDPYWMSRFGYNCLFSHAYIDSAGVVRCVK